MRQALEYLGAGVLASLALTACSANDGVGASPPAAAGGASWTPPALAAGGAMEGAGGAVAMGGAGTGGAGSGGLLIVAADAAAPYPYDPNVRFDWPEGSPTAKQCQAGHYVGTYTCDVTFGDAGGAGFPLAGPVDLVLAQGQDGEFLVVSGGTLKSAAGLIILDAEVIGQLSCTSGAFSGTLRNGTLSIPPFPPGGSFGGELSATFVSTGPKLEGTWALVGGGPFAGYGCIGPWTATLQP